MRDAPLSSTRTHGGRLRSSDGAVLSFFRVYAIQDLVLLTYLLIVLGLVLSKASSPEVDQCARPLYGALVAILLGPFVTRAPLVESRIGRGVIYRVSVLGVVLMNYLMLRDILPLVRPESIDADLYALDLRLFGVEPSLWLERFNRHGIVEWFAFFYFSYFLMAIAFMVVVIWWRKPDRGTTELAIGTTLLYSIGQLGYMAVPGYGPCHYLADSFHGPLQGGFFWSCVMHVVSAGSAMKDIFPSLHTAAPTFFTWFAIGRAKKDKRWRIPALITGFFAANIIISTMLLRWHYAIDVVAGLILGSSIGWLAPRLVSAEARQRRLAGMRQPWDMT